MNGKGAKMKDYKDYANLSNAEALERIKFVRASSGDKLTILAHYYALDEIVELADFVGDNSLQIFFYIDNVHRIYQTFLNTKNKVSWIAEII